MASVGTWVGEQVLRLLLKAFLVVTSWFAWSKGVRKYVYDQVVNPWPSVLRPGEQNQAKEGAPSKSTVFDCDSDLGI